MDIWGGFLGDDNKSQDEQIKKVISRAGKCPQCGRRAISAQESDSMIFTSWTAYCSNRHSWDVPG